jgi:hypothetical protein
MSDPQKPADDKHANQAPVADEPVKGLNLTLAYSLITIALLAAIGFALLIVLPFYHRH